MSDENWQNIEQKRIDLQLENNALIDEIKLRGALFGKNDDIDPEIENQFLKNVIAFEDAWDSPQIPLRSIFPANFQFPPVESMSESELSSKLDDICSIFYAHNIELGYNNNVPDRILYKHLIEDCIPNETIQPDVIEGFTVVLDGCHGNCEACFQKEYCSTAQEEIN